MGAAEGDLKLVIGPGMVPRGCEGGGGRERGEESGGELHFDFEDGGSRKTNESMLEVIEMQKLDDKGKKKEMTKEMVRKNREVAR